MNRGLVVWALLGAVALTPLTGSTSAMTAVFLADKTPLCGPPCPPR